MPGVREEQRRLPAEDDDARRPARRRDSGRCRATRRAPGRARAPRRAATSSGGRTAGSTGRPRAGCPAARRAGPRRASRRARAASADFRTRRYVRRIGDVHQRERGRDHDGGERGLRQVLQQRRQEQQQHDHDRRRRRARSPGDFEPACSATAVREPLAEIANPWNSPAATLAAPIPIISWFGSTSSPRRAAKLVDVAIVSVSETSTIPTAATSSGARSLTRHRRERRGRQSLRQRAHGLHTVGAEVEHRGDQRGADDRDEHGGHLLRDARQDQQHRERGEPERQRRRVRLVEARDERLRLRDEPVGVGGEPEELRQLADDDRDRRGRSCSRPGPPWRAGRRRSRACRSRDRSRSPRRTAPSSRRARSRSADRRPASSGTIAAKISGETDESGPSTSTRDGPNRAYPTRQAIVV